MQLTNGLVAVARTRAKEVGITNPEYQEATPADILAIVMFFLVCALVVAGIVVACVMLHRRRKGKGASGATGQPAVGATPAQAVGGSAGGATPVQAAGVAPVQAAGGPAGGTAPVQATGVTFAQAAGSPVVGAGSTSTATVQRRFCAMCGAALLPGSRFCPKCGAKQQ